MRTSTEGVNLITSFEGCVLHPYQDSVGVWTIGYGHTGPEVKGHAPISQAAAYSILRGDLATFERGVRGSVHTPFSQRQFDALVSFAYNVGLGALKSSMLLRYLNGGHYARAANEFLKWDKAGGRSLAGLTRRRRAERRLFLRGSNRGTRIRARLLPR